MTAYLHSLSTALPAHCLTQSDVRARATIIFGEKYPQFDRLSKTFDTAGIDKRYSVVPIDWFSGAHGWADRNAAFMTGAKAMFIDAAQRALMDAGWTGSDVDCVVTVCSTGIATPTLDAQVFSEMGFREDIMRVPLFGLGCAGGVSGLSIAQSIAAGRPDAKVLLVVVETCSLAFRADRLQKADIIATALFGDGSAAACISSTAPTTGKIVSLGQGHQKMWPDTLGIMGWDVDETGFGVVFDRSIPSFVAEEFAAATNGALKAANLNHSQIDRYVCHPGGAKVVDAIESALHLDHGSLDAERDTLRAAGNMSAPTVMFVMKSVLEAGTTGQMMACALGPGFTASFVPFHVGGGCIMATATALFLGFIVVQRLSELLIAKRNTARLLAKGAYEVGASHYPVMVGMHSAWIICLLLFGHDAPVAVGWLALFAILQIFRFWILSSLGGRWTTRIIIVEEPLVVRGPFKYFSHPNYMLVVAEIIVAPMVLDLVWVAVIFTVLNAAMLWVRIGVEHKALAPFRAA